ncbi:transglutaminase family protein, partial [Candidatus Binatia bacterium]|nr:transglutaminase family protein [Candidatus Binatia bacterium]
MHARGDTDPTTTGAGAPRDPCLALDAAVRVLDERIAAAGLDVWVGSEPTFTSRFSTDPAWTFEALGGDKEERAGSMLIALASMRPAAMVLRPVGRQYPREPVPRWCLALYERRDGRTIWRGPRDPLLCDTAPGSSLVPDGARDRFAEALGLAATRAGWGAATAWSLDGLRVAVALRAD